MSAFPIIDPITGAVGRRPSGARLYHRKSQFGPPACRKLDRNLRVSDRRAYALYWSVPQEQWTQLQPTFTIIANSFRAAS